MAVVAHDARMARPAAEGAATRAHLHRAAASGHAGAGAALCAPRFPEALAYLYDWFREQTRGEGMNGPAPLTHRDIQAWAETTDQHPAPHEVQGLLALDASWRGALTREPAPDTTPDDVVVTPAWPTKRGG